MGKEDFNGSRKPNLSFGQNYKRDLKHIQTFQFFFQRRISQGWAPGERPVSLYLCISASMNLCITIPIYAYISAALYLQWQAIISVQYLSFYCLQSFFRITSNQREAFLTTASLFSCLCVSMLFKSFDTNQNLNQKSSSLY